MCFASRLKFLMSHLCYVYVTGSGDGKRRSASGGKFVGSFVFAVFESLERFSYEYHL